MPNVILGMNREGTIRRFVNSLNPVLYLPMYKMSPWGRSPNLLTNADFETGNPPTGWTLTGAGAAIAQSNAQAHSGTYSARLTDAAAAGEIYQDNPSYTKYIGVTGKLTGWLYATGANLARLSVGDGATTTQSGYHTGGSAWEQFNISQKMAAAASRMRARVLNAGTSNEVIYADDLELTVPQVVDQSGYGRLVHPDGPSAPIGPSWKGYQGWYFDGVDDGVFCESDFIQNFPRTVMAWIYLKGWGSSYGRIVDASIVGTSGMYFYVSSLQGNNLTYSGDGITVINTSNNTIVLNRWYHVAASQDNITGKVDMYINGVKVISSTQSLPTSASRNVCIGNRLTLDRQFNGYISDLSIYQRVLSPTVINRHYEMTKGMYK